MRLDPYIQQPMFDLAKRAVEDFIANRGTFTAFALATLSDGEVQVIETSREFSDEAAAYLALLSELREFREQDAIIGSLICMPEHEPSDGTTVAAAFEIEAKGNTAASVVLRIVRSSGLPALAPVEEWLAVRPVIFLEAELDTLLDEFAGAVASTEAYAPDGYPEWSYGSYQNARTSVPELWARIRAQLKVDLDKAQTIDAKVREAFSAYDAGDKERGSDALMVIYNLVQAGLR